MSEKLDKAWKPALLLAVMLALCCWLVLTASGNYHWQWYRAWRYIGVFSEQGFEPGPLMRGLWLTLQLVAASLSVALLLGTVFACLKLSASPVGRLAGTTIVGGLRNTPLLMQLFIVHFMVAPVIGLGQFQAAVLALGAFEASYIAEILRAGVINVPRAQWDAALSLGMSMPVAARLVAAPQALRNVAAPLVSQVVSLIKDSSLVGAIAVADLTMQTRVVITETFLSFELWLITAAAYLFLTLTVSVPATMLERTYNRK